MQACELWQIVSTDYHFKEKPVVFFTEFLLTASVVVATLGARFAPLTLHHNST